MLLFNAHCHMFNLRAVYNSETRAVLEGRLRDVEDLSWLTTKVALAVVDVVMAIYMNEDPQYALTEIKGLKSLPALLESDQFMAEFDKQFSEGERPQAHRELDRMRDPDAKGVVANVWEFITRGLGSSTLYVGRELMKDLDQVRGLFQEEVETACVPLMMDFVPPDEPDTETLRKQLQHQVDGLMEVVAHYPGRVFPFLSVNPHRPDHLGLLHEHYKNNAFCGVKIYPSMGYSAKALEGIMAYCNTNRIPVLMHCNLGGFRKARQWAEQSKPHDWAPLLKEDYPEVRFCFGHFGGTDYFTDTPKQRMNKNLEYSTAEWTEKIAEMMNDPLYQGRIFADFSYHDALIKDPATYGRRLSGLLVDENGQPRPAQAQVMFGSDHWLLSMSMSEQGYWERAAGCYSLTDLGRKLFSENARRFLGLELNEDGRYAPNMEHYIDRVKAMRDQGGIAPGTACAAWLTQALDRPEPTA